MKGKIGYFFKNSSIKYPNNNFVFLCVANFPEYANEYLDNFFLKVLLLKFCFIELLLGYQLTNM